MSTDVTKKPPATVRTTHKSSITRSPTRHELYEEAAGRTVTSWTDWLRAEAEMTSKKIQTVAA